MFSFYCTETLNSCSTSTQFVIIIIVELCVVKAMVCCNLWAHLRVRYVVSIENTVVISGFYPTDCQITPFEVRVNHFICNGDG